MLNVRFGSFADIQGGYRSAYLSLLILSHIPITAFDPERTLRQSCVKYLELIRSNLAKSQK